MTQLSLFILSGCATGTRTTPVVWNFAVEISYTLNGVFPSGASSLVIVFYIEFYPTFRSSVYFTSICDLYLNEVLRVTLRIKIV